MQDTIAAIATPLGEGAIGIVRLSGPDAIPIVEAIFQGKTSLLDACSHSLLYGFIVDDSGRHIDECLVGLMKAPNTFTGEDVVEINCHGGVFVVETILNMVLKHGARPAEPGEFSKRAFLNGRLDLAQAEAVIDIVRAKSPRGLQLAANQLEGILSERIRSVRERILHLLAHMQVVIDYPEEGVDELTDDEIASSLSGSLADVENLLAGADAGKVYRDGIRLAIIGRPNVGKSSLLNGLLKEDRAIVTDIAGTTRDTIEAVALLGGIPITLVDTAGLRQSLDPVEQIGVERSHQAMATADLLFVVVDGTQPLTDEDRDVFRILQDERLYNTPTIVVVNKIDRPQVLDEATVRKVSGKSTLVGVSALTGEGLRELEALATKMVLGDTTMNRDALLITRARHRQALEKTRSSLKHALASFEMGMTPDVISVDLQESVAALGLITGESVGEEVVERIFAEFCVGK